MSHCFSSAYWQWTHFDAAAIAKKLSPPLLMLSLLFHVIASASHCSNFSSLLLLQTTRNARCATEHANNCSKRQLFASSAIARIMSNSNNKNNSVIATKFGSSNKLNLQNFCSCCSRSLRLGIRSLILYYILHYCLLSQQHLLTCVQLTTLFLNIRSPFYYLSCQSAI